jgi:guanylate kinase
MKEKVIILGKSGSGKNFLVNGLVDLGLKPCIKTTTRPIRNGEVNGYDYNFISKKEFILKVVKGDFLYYETFDVEPINSEKQTWYYGIERRFYENSDVVILTPNEFYYIIYNRSNIFVVYLDIERNIRKNRLHIRKDNNDSIDRRLDSDDLDFKDLKDYDLRITDPDFLASDVYGLII